MALVSILQQYKLVWPAPCHPVRPEARHFSGSRGLLSLIRFIAKSDQNLYCSSNDNFHDFFFLANRWFHGRIKREEAENLLKPREDGLFLVRESTNFPGDYTLCVCFNEKVEHYRIKYAENKLTIDDDEYFDNLGQLVEVSG